MTFDPATEMNLSNATASLQPSVTQGTGVPEWMAGEGRIPTQDVAAATPQGIDLAGQQLQTSTLGSIGAGLKSMVSNPMFLPMLAMIGVGAASSKRGGGGAMASMLPMMMMMMQQGGGSSQKAWSPPTSAAPSAPPTVPPIPVMGG